MKTKLVGRDRRARHTVRSAKSYRMNDRVGYVPKTKSTSSQFAANRAARISSAIRELLASFLIRSNFVFKTAFAARISFA
jgi:hypothetical protein